VAVINPWVAAAIALTLLIVAVTVAILLTRVARRGLKRVRGLRGERAPA
jgi:hypothetical protein